MNRFDELTIATTLHNNASMSLAMLRSFEQNVGQVKEIVVVDDASQERGEYLTLSSPVRVLRNVSAMGFCRASDLALRQVRTSYALLTDADVLFLPGDFSGAFQIFKAECWGWVSFAQVGFDGSPRSSVEDPVMPPFIFAAGNQAATLWQNAGVKDTACGHGRIKEVQAAHSSSTLVNITAYLAVGGFDPWYWQCESDIDLSFRFRRKRYKVGLDLVYQVKHEGAGGKEGKDSRVLDLYRARCHFYERFFPTSRLYLRPVLFLRHLVEAVFLTLSGIVNGVRPQKLNLRLRMLRTVFNGYC